MKRRWLVASRLTAHWGLGIVLGSIGGHEVWPIGLISVILGQLGAHVFRDKKYDIKNRKVPSSSH